MERTLKGIICGIMLIMGLSIAQGQTYALKSNLLSDVTLTLNGAYEMKIAPRWTVELGGNLNAWKVNN
ncbi:MAG: DUF3575 domain-containing protein, partial [Muribaculaceae bacterium]|nr:DUF3575 domain-containing protein [Muribaculaceae bacterium]